MISPKPLKTLQINIESRYTNTQTLQNILPMSIKFKKLSFWEYGYDLSQNTGKATYNTKMEIYKITKKSILAKFSDKKNSQKKMAINKRGESEIKFGYNSNGDFVVLENEGGKSFDFGQINKVFITSLDGGSDGFKYFWGREGDQLKGYLDQAKKTAFYVYIEK